MIQAILLIAVAIVIALLCYNLLVKRFDPSGVEERQRKRKRDAQAKAREQRAKNFIQRAQEALMRFLPDDRERIRGTARLLREAGLKTTPARWWLVIAACMLVGLAVGLFLAGFAARRGLGVQVIIVALLTAIGALAPRFYIAAKTRSRRAEIEAELPATLQLLSITVSAGQTLERSIKTVSQRATGAIADEFAQMDAEITYFGYSTPTALDNMAKRCGSQAVSLFCMSAIQSINAGTPIAEILKSQSKIASESYYAKVEEQSNKLQTKMVIPTIICILPPIFIVTIGPMVIRMMNELPNGMGL